MAWNILKPVLLYSAEKLDEIADSIVEIDNALKWGFNWDLGPFETWDAIGLKRSVERMEAEGSKVPDWVKAWIAAGHDSFYENREGQSFYYLKNEFRGVETRPELISLASLKQQNKVIRSNSGASLIDIGDGVACSRVSLAEQCHWRRYSYDDSAKRGRSTQQLSRNGCR